MTPREAAIQAVRDATKFIAGDGYPSLRVLGSGTTVDIVLEALKGCAVGHDGIVHRIEQVTEPRLDGVAVVAVLNEGRYTALGWRKPDDMQYDDQILYRLVEEDR